MQTVAVTASRHETAGEVVNDDDLAFLNDILLIFLEVTVCLQGIVDIVLKVEVIRIGQVLNAEILLCLGNTVCSKY